MFIKYHVAIFTFISSEYCAYDMRHIICSLKIDMLWQNQTELWLLERVCRIGHAWRLRNPYSYRRFLGFDKVLFLSLSCKKVIWKRTEKKRVSPRSAPRPLKINTARRLLPKNIPFYSCKGSFWISLKANLNSNSRKCSSWDLI